MSLVRERQPALYGQVMALRREHDEFRGSLSEILAELDQLPVDNGACLDDLCGQLEQLLVKLQRHHHREIDLMQEALTVDVGGEGG